MNLTIAKLRTSIRTLLADNKKCNPARDSLETESISVSYLKFKVTWNKICGEKLQQTLQLNPVTLQETAQNSVQNH